MEEDFCIRYIIKKTKYVAEYKYKNSFPLGKEIF